MTLAVTQSQVFALNNLVVAVLIYLTVRIGARDRPDHGSLMDVGLCERTLTVEPHAFAPPQPAPYAPRLTGVPSCQDSLCRTSTHACYSWFL